MNIKLIMKYSSYIKKYRVTMFWVFLLSLVLTTCSLFHTLLLSVIIDNVLVLKELTIFGTILMLIVMTYLIENLLKYMIGYLGVHITQMVTIFIRMKLLKSVLCKKISFILREKNADLTSTVLTDIQLISNFLCTKPIQIINSLLTVLVTFSILLLLNKKMAITAVLIITLQIVISFFLSSMAKKNQQEIRKRDSEHMGLLKQLFSSIKYIRAYRTEYSNEKMYYNFLKGIYYLSRKSYYISFLYNTTSSFLTFVGSTIIFAIGVLEVYHGNLTIGILFVFDSIIDSLYSGINNIVQLFFDLNKISVSFDRIDKIFKLENEESGSYPFTDEIQEVEYKKVSFQYNDVKVLEDLSVIFTRGCQYAIVGKSGVGKSTLIYLLSKLYTPNNGEITINHVNINDIKLSDLRNRITYVFQDGIIINGSIKENICFEMSDFQQERYDKVIKLCCIDEMEEKLEDGLNTQIREYGTNLSGGQKQRIFLARALLRTSDIYVFDEAFSQMDKQLENAIICSIIKEYGDKILIFVTHNIAVIKDFSQIIAIENGDKVFCGRHHELLNQSEVYRELNKREQQNEEEQSD